MSLLTVAVATDETARFALVHELLTQSMKGAALCLGTGEYPGIRCADTFTTEPPPETAFVSTAWFAASGGQPLAVYLHVSRELYDLLAATPAAVSSEPPPPPSSRRAESRQRITRVFTSVELDLEVRVENGSLTPARLANLKVGDLLEFDHPIERPVDAYLNGELAFVGQMADDGSRLIFTVDAAHDPPTA